MSRDELPSSNKHTKNKGIARNIDRVSCYLLSLLSLLSYPSVAVDSDLKTNLINRYNAKDNNDNNNNSDNNDNRITSIKKHTHNRHKSISSIEEIDSIPLSEEDRIRYLDVINEVARHMKNESQEKKMMIYLLENGWKTSQEIAKAMKLDNYRHVNVIRNRHKELFRLKKQGRISQYNLSFIAIKLIAEKCRSYIVRRRQKNLKNEYVLRIHQFVEENQESILSEFFKNADEMKLKIDYQNLEEFFGFEFPIDSEFYETLREVCFELIQEQSDFFEFNEYEFVLDITNTPNDFEINNFTSSKIDRLVKTKDFEIISYEPPQVINIKTRYSCPACGEIIDKINTIEKINQPRTCHNCGRKSRDWTIENNVLIDFIKVYAKTSQDMVNKSEIPFVFYGNNAKNIWKEIVSGNVMSAKGIVKTIKERKNKMLLNYYLDVIGYEIEKHTVEITEEDIKEIKKIAENEYLFNLLAASIAPHIKGKTMHRIKRGMLLYLVGGSNYKLPDDTKIRGNIHMIIYGQQGIGKSQIAEWIAETFRNANYIEGTKTSTGGIAGIAEKKGDKWILKDGILARSHKGYALIDEADKAELEHLNACLEVMSSGRSTMDKAGIRKISPAETSVLLLANPKIVDSQGRPKRVGTFQYDKTMHKRFPEDQFILGGIRNTLIEDRSSLVYAALLTPRESLEIVSQEYPREIVDRKLFEKYIYYAKKLNPRHTEETEREIQNYHVKTLFKNYAKTDKTIEDELKLEQVSMREKARIEKLAEAVAKIRLHEEVTIEDVQQAIEIYEEAQNSFKLSTYDFAVPDKIVDMTKHSIYERWKKQKEAEKKNEI